MGGERSFPASGLNDMQMAEILRGMGLSPVIYSKKTVSNFSEILHSYLDSNIPVVLSFDPPQGSPANAAGHATVCYGFWGRRVVQAKGSAQTQRYVHDRLILNDDNHPPYLEIGNPAVEKRTREYYEKAPTFAGVSSFIVPLHQRVSLTVEQFDALVGKLLFQKKFQIAIKSPTLNKVKESGDLVVRLFMTSCRNFKQGLGERGLNPRVETFYRMMPLPHFVWIAELHNKLLSWAECCLGEVLWDPTCNRIEEEGLLCLHYPECLIVNEMAIFERSGNFDGIPYEITLPSETVRPYSPSN
jgi:hypothetical protein